MQHRPRILRTLFHACSLSVVLVAIARLVDDGFDGRAAVLLSGSAVLLYGGLGMRFKDVRRGAGAPSQSLHPAMATMLVLLVGPWEAILGGVVASIAFDVTRHHLREIPTNVGTRVVPMAVAWASWVLLGGGSEFSLPSDYVPLLLAVAAFALSNEAGFVLEAMSAAANEHVSWRDEIARVPTSLGIVLLESLVGAGVAVLCRSDPWTAPFVLPLAASMYLALWRGWRIQKVTDMALDTFATIVDERDSYTFEHSDRVCDLSMMIGRVMGLSDQRLEALFWTSRLHDLGKVAVDNAVLNKAGQLTNAEFDVMRMHPEVSARILSSFSFDEYDADVVRCHHERFDGQGYLGRSKEQVPLESFIIAVADAYDAMTSDRPYRDGLPSTIALEEIALGSGTQFHPEVVRSFLNAMAFDPAYLFENGVPIEDDSVELSERRSQRPRVDPGDDIRLIA